MCHSVLYVTSLCPTWHDSPSLKTPPALSVPLQKQVSYIGYGGVKQIDLSDDQVVAGLAAGKWEDAAVPVEVCFWVGGKGRGFRQRTYRCFVWASV